MKDAAPDKREASTDLGEGSVDFARILKVAQAQGLQCYFPVVRARRRGVGLSFTVSVQRPS